MDFVTKSFHRDETLTSWTLLQYICPHFWAWLLNTIAITPKNEDKYVVKVFNWSEFHFSVMTLLQNPYFKSSGSYLKITQNQILVLVPYTETKFRFPIPKNCFGRRLVPCMSLISSTAASTLFSINSSPILSSFQRLSLTPIIVLIAFSNNSRLLLLAWILSAIFFLKLLASSITSSNLSSRF